MSEKRIAYNSQRRLAVIDQYISEGSYPTASFLAKKLECSVRTIQRDIDELILFYHAPIQARQGEGGYYYSDPTFFLKSVMLSEGELFSMALFDQLLNQYKNTPLEENLRKTFTKITEGLPDSVTVDSSFLKSNITFIPDLLPEIDKKVFETVFSSLQNHKTLTFDYRPLQKNTFMERKLDPYHAVCQKGNWYILGFCHDKNEVRVFNMSRIKNPTETSEKFKIPASFKPESYFDKELGVWLSAKQKYNVELLIDKEIGTFALERKLHSDQKITENPDGSILVQFETSQLPEVKRWVMGQGRTVKVLNPPELVQEIMSETEAMQKMYE
jgi:predicted DNA-binding transcriptional regulator YafY